MKQFPPFTSESNSHLMHFTLAQPDLSWNAVSGRKHRDVLVVYQNRRSKRLHLLKRKEQKRSGADESQFA
jgi:hypothetical protein